MKNKVPDSKIEHLGLQLSKILMFAAIAITIIGMVLFAVEDQQGDFRVFTTAYAFRFDVFWHGLVQLQGYSIMSLGILLLVAIPITKVLCYLFIFIRESNQLYTVICWIILAVITTSMLLT